MGTGAATGPDRALEAVQRAISNPLLSSVSIKGATSILINFTGSNDLQISELSEAVRVVQDEAHIDVDLIWGTAFDQNMGDEIRITVIATGFEEGFEADQGHHELLNRRRPSSAPAPSGQSTPTPSPQQGQILQNLSPPKPATVAPPAAPGNHFLPGFVSGSASMNPEHSTPVPTTGRRAQVPGAADAYLPPPHSGQAMNPSAPARGYPLPSERGGQRHPEVEQRLEPVPSAPRPNWANAPRGSAPAGEPPVTPTPQPRAATGPVRTAARSQAPNTASRGAVPQRSTTGLWSNGQFKELPGASRNAPAGFSGVPGARQEQRVRSAQELQGGRE